MFFLHFGILCNVGIHGNGFVALARHLCCFAFNLLIACLYGASTPTIYK
jgi:hypothetical protein